MKFSNELSQNEINFLNESDMNKSPNEENKNSLVNELIDKSSFSPNNESNNSDDKKISKLANIIHFRKSNSFPLIQKDCLHLSQIKIKNKKSLSDNDKNNIKSQTSQISFGLSSVEKKNEKSKMSNVYCKKINLIIFYSFCRKVTL